MTSASSRISSIDIGTAGEHIGKSESGLLASAFFYGVKSGIFSEKEGPTQRGVVGLDSQKYILDRSMSELKPVRLLRLSALEP
jgi:hypothetical protein